MNTDSKGIDEDRCDCISCVVCQSNGEYNSCNSQNMTSAFVGKIMEIL